MEFVNGKDDLPLLLWTITFMFETTNQIPYLYPHIIYHHGVSFYDFYVHVLLVKSSILIGCPSGMVCLE
jgi:hypothetical protein